LTLRAVAGRAAVDDGLSILNHDPDKVHRLFRGGLVFKAHRLLYHSTLGLRVIKKTKQQQRSKITLTQKT